MIEKAETSLGIPSPTELSAKVDEEQEQQGETPFCKIRKAQLGFEDHHILSSCR